MVYTAKVCRLLSPCTPRTLKQWLACRINHGPVTSHELAERAEIRHDLLRKYANENQHEQIPMVALARLCNELDDFSGINLALAPYGYCLKRIEGAPNKTVLQETLDVAAAGGSVVASVQAAVDDGIDVHEAAHIQQQIANLRRQADELELSVRTVSGGVQ
jgi:hypothetical protein